MEMKPSARDLFYKMLEENDEIGTVEMMIEYSRITIESLREWLKKEVNFPPLNNTIDETINEFLKDIKNE